MCSAGDRCELDLIGIVLAWVRLVGRITNQNTTLVVDGYSGVLRRLVGFVRG